MNAIAPRPHNNRGQGRKPGGLNQRTKALRAVAEKAIAEGVHPLEVMLDNMRFYHEKADVLQVAILDKVTAKGVLKGEDAMKMLNEFRELGEFRMKAQSCAVDAAPYVHPRLSATQGVDRASPSFMMNAGLPLTVERKSNAEPCHGSWRSWSSTVVSRRSSSSSRFLSADTSSAVSSGGMDGLLL